MKKLSEEKLALIRKRILQGIPLEDIATEAQVSVTTVKRYKKKMPVLAIIPEEANTGDDTIVYDTRLMMTKQEKAYASKLAKDLYLYEDKEEGWVYHYDKMRSILKSHGLWWGAIVYPESAPPDWIERLEKTGLQVAISPLHDSDKWTHDSPETVNPETGEIIPKGARYKQGDRKKAHWHILVKFNVSTSFKEANELIRGITYGPYIQKVRSLKHAYDYFTHSTDEAKRQGKYQYEKDEIILLNGFTVTPNKSEVGLIQCEIVNDIIKYNLDEMHKVAIHYRNQPEIMSILWAKPGFFTSLVRSLWKKNHPEGKVQLTRELTLEEYMEICRSKEEKGE